jgi:hypothetical protein
MWSLYVLICPIDNIVRYVGISENPNERLKKGHLVDKRENPHKTRWIDKLKQLKLKPTLKIIRENLTEIEAENNEIALISIYRSILGSKLTNIAKGGNRPPAKMGEAHHKYWKGKTGGASSSSKKIDKYDLNGNFIKTYLSIVDAELELKRKQNRSNIGMVCNGKRQTSLGFIWRWHGEPLSKYKFKQKHRGRNAT